MATYVVTAANWNDPAFWASINVVNGDTLDMSALGNTFSFDMDAFANFLTITSGGTSFSVGAAGSTGHDATLGSGNPFNFDNLIQPDGGSTVIYGNETHTIVGGNGADSADLGGGDDTASGGAGSDTFSGGNGADVLAGDDGNDTIDGGRGNDSIEGGTGEDRLLGGTGNGRDTLRGGDDNDFIAGLGGNDQIFGDAGDDEIQGGGGNDILEGGTGNDTITAGANNDSVDGGSGDDFIIGLQGANTLVGGDGADSILGGTQADTIFGDAGNDTIDGGTGNDSLTGGDGDDIFVYQTGDGSDTIADFNFGNTGPLNDGDSLNNDFINLSNFYDHIDELREDFDDDGILNQSNSGTVDYSNNADFGTGSILLQGVGNSDDLRSENTGVVCFTKGTLIATPRGDVPIEVLRPGDWVLTKDNGPKQLLWVASRQLSPAELTENPKLRPIALSPKLLGTERPLFVSPQHGMVLNVEGEEKMIRATHLARMTGGTARIASGRESVTYFHLLFEEHQVVFANGAASESFFPGPEALKALTPDVRAEFSAIFPHLDVTEIQPAYGATARSFCLWKDLPPTLNELR